MSLRPAEKGHSPFPSSERAIYGFALYLGSYTLLGTFCLWAFLPDEWLYLIGFTYFPQKYWAVAVPVYLIVCLVVFVCLYVGTNFLLVPNLTEQRTVTDAHSLRPLPTGKQPRTSIPPLHDIPISEVNKRMFRSRQLD